MPGANSGIGLRARNADRSVAGRRDVRATAQRRPASRIWFAPARLRRRDDLLDRPIDDLLQRCVLMGGRPLFRDEASFRKLYMERLPYYRQADYRVESGGEAIRVVEQILGLGIFGVRAQ